MNIRRVWLVIFPLLKQSPKALNKAQKYLTTHLVSVSVPLFNEVAIFVQSFWNSKSNINNALNVEQETEIKNIAQECVIESLLYKLKSSADKNYSRAFLNTRVIIFLIFTCANVKNEEIKNSLMTDSTFLKMVFLLPSLMVPPIWPGLCSGISTTWKGK